MKKAIVITSIFESTEAVRKFSQLDEYALYVIGDQKSPVDWCCENSIYCSVKEQVMLPYELVKVLPFNHYSRKMIGYLLAIENGADLIIDTDDDNIPKSNWGFPKFDGNFDCVTQENHFVNVYRLFTKQKIWPRGLPLQFINTEYDFTRLVERRPCKIGVWQGLADEDPDVDAIYRLTSDQVCHFEERSPVVLSFKTACPFNTQNTMITKELFPLLYLPTYVTFRFTDILRGLIAQPIMWLYGYQLGFTSATVMQKRNPHDYFKDFISEIPMYEHAANVIPIVEGVLSSQNSISDNLYAAYCALIKESVVTESELITLEAWLSDMKRLV